MADGDHTRTDQAGCGSPRPHRRDPRAVRASRLPHSGLRQLVLTREQAERHYGEHAGKPFFGELVDFIIGGPLVALALEGPDAIPTVRAMMGATDPLKSPLGTIRGDLALVLSENVVHGSDSPESATRELAIFFADGLLD